ncbi:MAG: ABC transporter substrate-binding protein [Candidatus Rokubacteria bacterium]|nr:ABC transporter substrate-binding protein [Candidatus Rokubacteria bacterium]
MRRRIATLVTGVLWLLAGAVLPADAAEPRRGGTLRAALRAEASTLDPHRGASGTDHMYLYPIFDTLVRFDAKMTPQPGLAASWEVPDPQTLVLKLRPNVRFHDGTPFDAEAVKFNLERGQDRKTAAVASELSKIAAIETPDALTVRLKLSAPDASLLLTFADRAGMMISPTAARKLGDQFGRNPVGAGEYRFVRWVAGSEIRYERFAEYWEPGRPYLDAVVLKIMSDGDTRVAALRSGQVDFVMEIPPQLFPVLKGERGLKTHEEISLAYWRLYLNFAKPPLDKKAVREAINYAIDRDTLVRTVMFGLAQAAVSPFPSVHWAHDTGLRPYPYDPGRAKAKLAEAGVPNGFSLDMVVEAAPEHVRRAEILQAQLGAVGIKLDIKAMELAKGVQSFFRAKSVMAANYRWTGRPDPDQTVRGMFHSTGFFNPGAYKVPRLEELLDHAKATYRQEERRRLYHQIARLIQEEALDVPLFYGASLEAMSASVHGYQPSLLGKPMFRGVWIEGK